ncbi:ABC transporter ATP-binding protein [Cellulomonas fimi]|uniref:ABC-type quaternary amine transporter n=1 Tax=Cellulomonas fimi TaxID=1708 RepID=A0A7Y0M129_CELFI|nr:ATP-binding cassette domain-containing protein [Cellulomonas fimi]NMR21103.1 ATP-binding cassette domain-containing protein [Cellulomonas fimi]
MTTDAGPRREPTGDPVIRFEAARKEYPDGTVAVEGLDLDVREHELLALVGPSGCGKSTILRMANRLVELTSGRVLVEGTDVAQVDPVRLRRRIGYVIQDVGLFPHRTVAQNIGTVPALLGWDARRTRSRTAELLELVGLEPGTYARRYPHQLSGGERQRVGVARALAVDPPVLLMDEPFGAVDPEGRRRLQQEFWRIQRELGTTVMLVTHDIDEAVRLGDRIAVLSRGGHLEQLSDAVELLARPAPGMVTDFVGSGRAVRLLGIGRVTPADLAPSDEQRPGALHVGARLDDALAALASSGGEAVPVTGDGGVVVGRLTSQGLLAALARMVEESGDDAGDRGAGAEVDGPRGNGQVAR